MDDGEEKFKRQLYEARYNIKETMQRVQLQFDIMKNAVDACAVIDVDTEYDECTKAVDAGIKESVKFIEFNVKLVRLMSELRQLIYSKKVRKK